MKNCPRLQAGVLVLALAGLGRAVAAQEIIPPDEGRWYLQSANLGKTSSPQWKAAELSGAAWIESLRNLSPEKRRLKIQAFAVQPKTLPDVNRLYRNSLLLTHFLNDVRSLKLVNELSIEMGTEPVTVDPIFVRSAFIGLSFGGGILSWKDLGLKLLKRYPNDPLVKRAFLYSSAKYTPTLETAVKAYELMEELPRSTFRGRMYHVAKANIAWSLYGFTNKKTYLQDAISQFRIVIAENIDPGYKSLHKEYLAHLEDLYKQGKYKGS